MNKTSKLYSTLRLLRPKQWIKNFFIFGSIVFSGQLFNIEVLIPVLFGFAIFCALSSAIYIVNDILDVEKDKLHPFKKFRPLAHGDLPIAFAIALATILTLGSLIAGAMITPAFFLIIIVYVILQVSYSAVLKQMAVIDILALAAGYIIRVLAGEFASGYHISVWLLLAVISLSLFLASGKRRQELTLISKYSAAQIAATRRSLSHYSEKLLDIYISMFATSTFITYSLFTFLENPTGFKPALGVVLPDFLPSFFTRKWLMLTIFPLVYALLRYLQDIYEKHEGESPEKVFLSDKPFLISLIIWAVLVIITVYFISPY